MSKKKISKTKHFYQFLVTHATQYGTHLFMVGTAEKRLCHKG